MQYYSLLWDGEKLGYANGRLPLAGDVECDRDALLVAGRGRDLVDEPRGEQHEIASQRADHELAVERRQRAAWVVKTMLPASSGILT